MDDRGEVDCALDWCSFTPTETTKTAKPRTTGLRIIELYLTPDKVVFPQSIATFGSFVIFEHGLDKIKGHIPFLSPWVRYEFTIADDLAVREHAPNDGMRQCVIINCRWRIPLLDDQMLSDLLTDAGAVTGQETLDCVRAGIVKRGGYDEATDTYNPKAILDSLPETDRLKIQNSPYMILRYCAPSVLLYGHSSTTRTSYSTLKALSQCLLSSAWYQLFFQWFKRMPETLLPQESRFLRELAVSDLPIVKRYFCIQPSPENKMMEECIHLYHHMKNGPHKNRDTLCHAASMMKSAGIRTPEGVLMPFATKKFILRTECYASRPDRWILTFGDFDAEKKIVNLLVSLKKKESSGSHPPSDMFDREYIRTHEKLDDIQKGILYSIVGPRNIRRLLIFSGSAGSGKTTLIKALLESAKSYAEKQAALLAPPPPPKFENGKPPKPQEPPNAPIGVFTAYGFMAATIRISTGHKCTMTMSRAIAIMDIEENVSLKLELRQLKVVIIDEMSTANMTVVANLLSGMPELERVFFFGDPQQMPTIERGSVCECFTRMFKSVSITGPDTLDEHLDCTIFNLTKNYRQAGKRILIDNFERILKSDPRLDFKTVKNVQELRAANHPFVVIPIAEIENTKDITRAMNILAQQYLQSAEDSQQIMIMAQRNRDVEFLKECLQGCDTYVKRLLPANHARQTTLVDALKPHPSHLGRQNHSSATYQQKGKPRPLVVGELVKTTMNWYFRLIAGVPNVDYVKKGKVQTVPVLTSSLSNNDIGILHAIYDVNMSNGCVVKSHTSTAAHQTRSTKDTAFARILVLKSPNSKIKVQPSQRNKFAAAAAAAKTKTKKKKETEYLFINSREYALTNVVPRDVSTISVSQGQETDVSCIYLPSHMFDSKTFERSQFYTAVTRAKQMVILITPVVNGRLPAVENIISNDTIPGKTNFTAKYQELLSLSNV